MLGLNLFPVPVASFGMDVMKLQTSFTTSLSLLSKCLKVNDTTLLFTLLSRPLTKRYSFFPERERHKMVEMDIEVEVTFRTFTKDN